MGSDSRPWSDDEVALLNFNPRSRMGSDSLFD